MKCTITILILSTFFFSSFSQSLPRLSELLRYEERTPDSLTIEKHEFYRYDQNGNRTSILHHYYDADGIEYSERLDSFQFDNNNRLIKSFHRDKSEVVDLWLTISFKEYFYDQNGCVIEEIWHHNTVPDSNTTLFVVDSECNILEEWDSHFPDRRLYFEYPDGSTKVTWHETDWKYKREEVTYNELGHFKSLLTNYYDSLGNQEDFWIFHNTEYDFTYDPETGFIVYVVARRYNSDFNNPVPEFSWESKYSYDYYCNGLKKDHVFIGSINTIYKWKYEGLNECFEETVDQDIPISITPNPSNGWIKIEGPILESGNTKIRVFGIDGKGYVDFTLNQVSTFHELDLSFLKTGLYVLYLNSADTNTQSKIFISN